MRTAGAAHSTGFYKRVVTCICYCSTAQNSLPVLKLLSALPVHPSFTPPHVTFTPSPKASPTQSPQILGLDLYQPQATSLPERQGQGHSGYSRSRSLPMPLSTACRPVPSRRACTSWLGRVVCNKTVWFSNCTSTPWIPGRRERAEGSRGQAPLCWEQGREK